MYLSQERPPRIGFVESEEVVDFPCYMLGPSSPYHGALVQSNYATLPPDQVRFALGKRYKTREQYHLHNPRQSERQQVAHENTSE